MVLMSRLQRLCPFDHDLGFPYWLKLLEGRTKKILLRKTKDGRIHKRTKKTIHAANILFKQMPEISYEEETTTTSGTEELETRRANWGMWPMKSWP